MDGGPVSREATKGSLFTITCVYAGRHDDRPVKWAVNVTSRDTLWSALSLEQQQQQLIGWRPLLEENDLVRPCPATGHPDRQCVSGRERYTFTRDYALENASAELHERTSVLEIHDVEDGDRGAYYCMVGNEHGWNNATVFVRIKGANMPNWKACFSVVTEDSLSLWSLETYKEYFEKGLSVDVTIVAIIW